MPSELKTEVLKGLADNKVLFDTLLGFLIDQFEDMGVVEESDRSDVQLGQIYRARIVGAQTITKAFKQIEKLKSVGASEPRIPTHR